MKKVMFALAAVAALALTSGNAEAAKRKPRTAVTVTPVWFAPWTWAGTAPWQVRDPRLAASNFAVGAGATGAYFALRHNHHNVHNGIRSAGAAYGAASVACAAVSPIVGTLVANRPLTLREVWVSTGNCALPIVGGLMVNAWFDQNGWQ